uniref:Uncharacterized protein n=3 Tax=Phaeomonas parva TaxID=124430 RepID=A0A7S1TUQ9_9STRA|mmetsp:Transcript_15620/g.47589  ORF Transcript_15620/g.47589 Transcript_15620/m.47589 type:complete len:332 (+) Transcript_15620:140-1135(+)
MFPSTLTYGREGLDEKMAFYEKELGLDGKAFGRMVVTHPALLGLNVEDNVASKIAFFEDDLYLSREEMRVLVRRNPRILSASLEQKLEPSCTAIMEALDMDPVDVARMVLKAPGILLLDTERKLEPFWDWLGGAERDGGLGCTMAEVRAITRRCPSLCSRSLDALRERAAAIKSYLGVGAPALRIIVSRFPQVLSMDATTRLAELGACLERKIGMGQRQELAALVCTQPSLLGFKVESLEGKLDALLRGAAAAAASASGKDPTSRVRELVAKRPLILGLGLDRLESRMALLNAHGRDFETLGSFAMLTEARFRDWEAKRAAEAAAPDPGLE